MRKPSCLISCTQPAPDGGRSARDGRQGGMKRRTMVDQGSGPRSSSGIDICLTVSLLSGHWPHVPIIYTLLTGLVNIVYMFDAAEETARRPTKTLFRSYLASAGTGGA